ncbi:HipA family kinase [Candidatus Venteria ishoeyi]|uniref:HipA-like kinase domain-containing protein n=1 Tax=Candidatus Venteria ishoeyi TaxID=1899563 RepID=A0A1H6FG70_9GAMM|nr:HipA family kinase [Candidatus Venteria ishoeyi]SEH08339.1 Uncharacterised protein [Candidatus Venteria ishoeyi]
MDTTIVEILNRSIQGVTKPFLCRGNDDNLYFVKGFHAGQRSQICEIIAGQLGRQLGLPIAPFTIADIPEVLLDYETPENKNALRAGYAFASCKQEPIGELNLSAIHKIPTELQQKIFAFDWWIRNEDRKLTEHGGNPNLFWRLDAKEDAEQLVVIDHNLAFDKTFSKTDFAAQHAFSHSGNKLLNNRKLQIMYESQFERVMLSWSEICTKIPETWKFIDDEMSTPSDFDFEAAHQQLMCYQQPDFWMIK